MAGSEPQTIVARIDWNLLKPLLEAGRPRSLLSRVAPRPRVVKSGDEKAPIASEPNLIERLVQSSAATRKDVLTEFVRTEAAVVLGLRTPDLVDPARSLFNIGMDSLMAIELKSRLERAVATTLPSALAFNYPTVNDLVKFLDTIVPERAPVADDNLQDVNDLLNRLPDMPIAEVDSLLAKIVNGGTSGVTDLRPDEKRELLARLLQKREAQQHQKQAEQGTDRRRTPAGDGPPLRPIPRNGDLELSFGQERVWFLEQLQPESLFYNVLDLFRFTRATRRRTAPPKYRGGCRSTRSATNHLSID